MWICRLWNLKSWTDNWTSDETYEFETEKDAREFGEFFLSVQDVETVSKDYDVFERRA